MHRLRGPGEVQLTVEDVERVAIDVEDARTRPVKCPLSPCDV